MKKITKWTSLIVLSFTIWSCDRLSELDLEDSNEEDLSEATEILDTESMVDEDIALQEDALASLSNSSSSRLIDFCAEVTVDSTNHTITIDFGDGCTGPYGRTRSGKITSTYGGSFDDNEANRVITFEDYFVNSREVTGSIELGNFNLTEDGTFTSTQTLSEYTVTFPNGAYRSISGSTVREIVEGFGDYDVSNNKTLMTGSFTAVTTNGTKHEYNILEPVRLSYECLLSGNMLRIEGVVEVTRTNDLRSRTKTIDYGEVCDDQYTVTIDNELVTVVE